MKKFVRLLTLGCCLGGFAAAQEPFAPGDYNPRVDIWMHEFLMRQFDSQRVQAEESARKEARRRELDFVKQANEFVQAWTRFAAEYNQRRAFNIKDARKVSEAFRKLERSQGWPAQASN